MGASSSSGDDFVSEINVTPFVDVMLVLLIIFMVTAPMMVEGMDVDLPPVQSSEILPAEDDHMILTLKDDGNIFLDEYPTSLEDLPTLLRVNVLQPGKQLFLRADRNVPYGLVVDIMSRAREIGIENIGMVTTTDNAAPELAEAVGSETGARP